MTKRLQILMPDADFARLQAIAEAHDVSVGEWVRRAVRQSFDSPQVRSAQSKIAAVREALTVYAPTADIDQMNEEIERGYQTDLH